MSPANLVICAVRVALQSWCAIRHPECSWGHCSERCQRDGYSHRTCRCSIAFVCQKVTLVCGGVQQLEPAKRRYESVQEPASAAKWSKLFPCKPQHAWEADEKSTQCQICGIKFTLIQRKHHCRFCCRLVCDLCSRRRFTLKFNDKLGKERVDDGCYNFLCHRSE